MPYTELIKNFNRTREYMREFYLYGFKSREEYGKKSARSYDDERRRIESWLGDCMRFHRTLNGKKVFLSIDSRRMRHNPLYKAWKAKSFTDGDITLHFLVLDILHRPDLALSLSEITAKIDRALSEAEGQRLFDESTVRRKLNEYVREGILTVEKRGKSSFYRRAASVPLPDRDVLDFFSEAAPCGVIGSFVLDKMKPRESLFALKHHYITGAMDSEILYLLFEAMGEKRYVTLEVYNRNRDKTMEREVVPLRIFFSVQNGRQYLMAYVPRFRRITSLRLDGVLSVKAGEKCGDFDGYRDTLRKMQAHLWGVSTQGRSESRLEQVEFTVRFRDYEEYIYRRLEREKRCGLVERLDQNTARFSAEVFDATELIPWIRTFICRIVEFHFSDRELEERFRSDLSEMYRLYGLEEGGEEA